MFSVSRQFRPLSLNLPENEFNIKSNISNLSNPSEVETLNHVNNDINTSCSNKTYFLSSNNGSVQLKHFSPSSQEQNIGLPGIKYEFKKQYSDSIKSVVGEIVGHLSIFNQSLQDLKNETDILSQKVAHLQSCTSHLMDKKPTQVKCLTSNKSVRGTDAYLSNVHSSEIASLLNSNRYSVSHTSNKVPAPLAFYETVSSLTNNSMSYQNICLAPLPPWYPPIIPVDALGEPLLPGLQSCPILSISPDPEGVLLRWELKPTQNSFELATVYELFSYAASDIDNKSTPTSDVWQKIADILALPLPMSCTLSSLFSNNVYYFSIRSTDKYNRYSDWSNIVHANVL